LDDAVQPEREQVTRSRLFTLIPALLWLLALSAVVGSSVGRLAVPSWGNPVADSVPAQVTGPIRVGQTFTAPMPGLSGIDIMLDRAAAHSVHQVTFHLKDSFYTPQDLVTQRFRTDDVPSGKPCRFEFTPLWNSQGRTYYFYLESSTSVPGDAIAVHYTPHFAPEGARAHLNDQPIAGSLRFDTIYALRTRDKASLLLARIVQGRPHLFGSAAFYVGLAVAYALLLGAFLWQIAHAVLDEDRP
jgi:hypothetical protein